MSDLRDILLLDDESEKARLLENRLEELDCKLTTVNNLNDILCLCQEQQYGVLVLPAGVQDSFATADGVRAQKNLVLPILFRADSHRPELEAAAYRYANAEIIFPPYEQHVVERKIRNLGIWRSGSDSVNRINRRCEDLEASIQKMRSFVGIVAHDLRAPLGKLINISELLIAGVDEEELPTFYRLLHKTSKRCFDLVNDILDLTALESGRVRLNFQKCDLWPLAIQVVSELGYLANEKEIRLRNEIRDPLEVRADSRRMFQVLVNLITNAIKFTPRRGAIVLSAESLQEGVRMEIKDSGIGIPAYLLDRLFEKHEKISTPGTDGERGTGLGLALSQQLVHAHGSRISVESEEGKGSTFSFVLPWWRFQSES